MIFCDIICFSVSVNSKQFKCVKMIHDFKLQSLIVHCASRQRLNTKTQLSDFKIHAGKFLQFF